MRSRILLLGGSVSGPSRTGALLKSVGNACCSAGADVALWDLADHPVPPARRGQDDVAPDERGGGCLVYEAGRADGVVLCSPVYHNSYSGALKNALDHLTDELRGKPVALTSTSGGMPSPQAVDHLRLVVRALHAIAIPTQLITADADYAGDGDGYRLVSPSARARLQPLVAQLLWFSELLRGGAGSCPGHHDRPSGTGGDADRGRALDWTFRAHAWFGPGAATAARIETSPPGLARRDLGITGLRKEQG
jgi:azobenzene reductase